MTDHIEDRILADQWETAQLHQRWGEMACCHLPDSLSPEIVAAMCRVAAAGRALLAASTAWAQAGMDDESSSDAIDKWRGAEVELVAALAALDEMGRQEKS